jgi:hypothetical protein
VSGYDRYILFPLLVHAHKNLNPIAATEIVVPFVVNSEKGTSLCDFSWKLMKKWFCQWSRNNRIIIIE